MKGASHFWVKSPLGKLLAETKHIRMHLAGGMPHGLMHTSPTDVSACWECTRWYASLRLYGYSAGNHGFILAVFGVFLPHLPGVFPLGSWLVWIIKQMVGKTSCAELPIESDLCHNVLAPCARHGSGAFIKRDKSQWKPTTALSSMYMAHIDPWVLKERDQC